MDFTLEIGGIRMAVEGARWSDASLPRNFAPFLAAGTAEALMRIEGAEAPALAGAEPLSTSYNDLGSASLYDAGSAWAVALIPARDDDAQGLRRGGGLPQRRRPAL